MPLHIVDPNTTASMTTKIVVAARATAQAPLIGIGETAFHVASLTAARHACEGPGPVGAEDLPPQALRCATAKSLFRTAFRRSSPGCGRQSRRNPGLRTAISGSSLFFDPFLDET